jgi:hypothetical protein
VSLTVVLLPRSLSSAERLWRLAGHRISVICMHVCHHLRRAASRRVVDSATQCATHVRRNAHGFPQPALGGIACPGRSARARRHPLVSQVRFDPIMSPCCIAVLKSERYKRDIQFHDSWHVSRLAPNGKVEEGRRAGDGRSWKEETVWENGRSH